MKNVGLIGSRPVLFFRAVYARFVSSSMVWGSNTKGQIVRLIMGISLLLLTFASAMFTAESDLPFDCPHGAVQHAFFAFWQYLYFGVVTMSTGELPTSYRFPVYVRPTASATKTRLVCL